MAEPRTHVSSMFSAAVVIACFALLVTGCKKAEEASAPEVYVHAVHPEQHTISEWISADALLAPLAQAAISPKVTAPVKKFFVQRGSKVMAGQLLATLENSDLEAAALDNKGGYTAAQATYDIETRAVAPADYSRAELDLAQAKATLDLDQSIVDSRTQLLAQGAIPGRDLDTAKAALVQAHATYDLAKQHLDGLQQVGRKATLANAEGQLASAEGKYLGAQAQLSYTEIHSPIDGVVTDRPLFAGETAAAGTPLLTVMDTSALLAKSHIAQMQAQQLTIGAPATVAIPGIADPVPAKVMLISPVVDPGSTTVEVWLRIENPRGSYRVGTAAHANVLGRTASSALTIPVNAVQTAQDGVTKSVMLISADGTAHKRNVTLGIQTPELVQVLTGVNPTDMVITTGGYAMDEGTKVKIGTPPVSADDEGEDKAGDKEKDGK